MRLSEHELDFFALIMPGGARGVIIGKVCKVQQHGVSTTVRYRQHGEQTVIVCVLMHFLQPYMSVGNQEVIIIFVPEGMRYNRVRGEQKLNKHTAENNE